MVKMVVMDLDGTLIDFEQHMSLMTKDCLRKLKEKKIVTVINSGRVVKALKEVVKQFDLEGLIDYLIGANGAELYNVKTKEYQIIDNLEIDCIKEIINKYSKYEMGLGVYDDSFLINKLEPIAVKRFNMVKYPIELFDFNKLNKVYPKVLAIFDPKHYNYFKDLIDLEKDDRYDAYFSNKMMIEFVPKMMNKSKGNIILGNNLGIKADEMLCFGDGDNDIEMLREHIGVCVGDNPKLLAVAKYQTDIVENDGFAQFIKKYFNFN